MINYKKCQESIKNEVLSTAKSCSSKYVLTKDTLATWDDIIISMIEKRISHLLLSQLSNKCSADVIIFHFVNRTTLEKKLPFLRKLKNKNYSFYFASQCVKNDRIWSYSGPHFPAFRLNTSIQSECGKMRTRITLNTDTFYAVSSCYLNRYGEM